MIIREKFERRTRKEEQIIEKEFPTRENLYQELPNARDIDSLNVAIDTLLIGRSDTYRLIIWPDHYLIIIDPK